MEIARKSRKFHKKRLLVLGQEKKNYTLYDVGNDNTKFVQAGYKS